MSKQVAEKAASAGCNVRVLDLFSGIGGFSLGLERAGMRTVQFVEINPYCQAVLRRHWPAVPIHGDVTTFDGVPCDVMCGGFPCQDISHAGAGAGIEGERSGLWSSFARLIGLIRPQFVIVENVAALLDRGMGTVLGDLARIGYDAEWSIISACSVGAPHVRRRVFIVAYPDSIYGRQRVWYTAPREVRALQALDRPEGPRTGWRARMANPSKLYGGADGLPHGLDRNQGIGNSIVPQIAEEIGKAIMRLTGYTTKGSLPGETEPQLNILGLAAPNAGTSSVGAKTLGEFQRDSHG
jgi:DNA (cytosine-5)-methyltransferase 1